MSKVQENLRFIEVQQFKHSYNWILWSKANKHGDEWRCQIIKSNNHIYMSFNKSINDSIGVRLIAAHAGEVQELTYLSLSPAWKNLCFKSGFSLQLKIALASSMGPNPMSSQKHLICHQGVPKGHLLMQEGPLLCGTPEAWLLWVESCPLLDTHVEILASGLWSMSLFGNRITVIDQGEVLLE